MTPNIDSSASDQAVTEYFVTYYAVEYPKCRYGGYYDDTYLPADIRLDDNAIRKQDDCYYFRSYCGGKPDCYGTKLYCERKYRGSLEHKGLRVNNLSNYFFTV